MRYVLMIIFTLHTLGMSAQCCNEPNDSIEKAVARLMHTYPEARLQDIYKSFFQDRFGPGHLLSDTVAAQRYLDKELETNNAFEGPRYETTGWKNQFYRVNLSVVKDGLISREMYFNAFYRSTLAVKPFSTDEWRKEWKKVVSATSRLRKLPLDFKTDSLTIDSMMQAKPQAVHHSRAYNKAYAPHYRIIARDIFEQELLPLLKQDMLKRVIPETTIKKRKDISPTTLIVMYGSDKSKKLLLKTIKKMRAEVIYDYRMMSGLAIKKSDSLSLEETKKILEQVEGVLSVSYDHIMQLH